MNYLKTVKKCFREQKCNERSLHHELKKMNLDERRKLAKKLLEEADAEEGGNIKHPYQETDFENPFNTKPPTYNTQVSSGQPLKCVEK